MAIKCPKCQTENPETSLFCAGCGTKLDAARKLSLFQTETLQTPLKELTTGSTFAARYQIIEELGHGGMGRVYRALDRKLNEEVALKLVRPEIAADRSTLERFSNELKLARKISHPHVGRMYELMEEAGTTFITMEYVAGQDLRGLIRQTGQLTVGKAIAVAKEICEGLAEAHKQGIVHRDLKPSNIIIDRAGEARIMDFGIARSIAVKSRTGPGVMIGTPEFMSPEQVEGKDVDARSDIYSLGIILYEMLTGRVPFEGETPFTIGIKHKSEAPADPKFINPGIPDNLSRIILKCLEKERSNRYQSAAELRDELERVEKGLPTAERAATERAAPTRRPFTSREITVKFNVRKIFLPAILVLAVIAAAVFFLIIRKPGPALNPKLVLVSVFVNRTVDTKLDTLGRMIAYQIEQGLSQTGIAEAVPTVSVLESSRLIKAGSGVPEAQDELRALAERSGAGTIVSGAYYLIDGELQFHAEITDVVHRRPIQKLEPFKGSLGERDGLMTELRQRVLGALAAHFAPVMSEFVPKLRRPPLYEAFEEFLMGLDLFGVDYEQTERHFARALELDPTFVLAKLYTAVAYSNQGRYEEAEALLRSVIEARDELTPFQHRMLDWFDAQLKGQHEQALRYIREADKLAPNLYTVKYIIGLEAYLCNRPRETVEVYGWMDSQDPKLIFTRPATAWWFGTLAEAHHMLAEYREELKVAKQGRTYFPKDQSFAVIEVRALAALGKIGDLRKVVEGCLNVDATSGTPGDVMMEAASELYAHGHKDASREFAAMAIEWAESRPEAERKTEGRQGFYANALYFAGRFDEAEKIYVSLATEYPENIHYQGRLGILAARRGDRDEALKIFEELGKIDRPFLFGDHLYRQARIASLLGDKERAVALLRDAFSQGLTYGVYLHQEIDLEPLWDYPPFKELLRPKG